MWISLIVFAVIFVIWVLLNMKTSRPDGHYIDKKTIHPYRTAMSFIMPSRNGSVVFFDAYVNAEPLLKYIEEVDFETNITHAVVGALTIASDRAPTMNNFISGYRMYRRKDWILTFSMKRKRKDGKSKIAAVKLATPKYTSFRELCDDLNSRITVQRSDKKTKDDKELSFFQMLPRPVFRWMCSFVRRLDYYNILPKFFIDGDAFYTSIFIANLGSVDMAAGYHHLYEWGNCPLFIMVGKITDRPMVEDGKVVVRKCLHLRYSYDERIDDGLTAGRGIRAGLLALEDPYTYFGCTKADGSDNFVMRTGHDIPLEQAAYPPLSQMTAEQKAEAAKLGKTA